MRIVFMGTPDFAVPSLEKLIDNKFEIVGVVCQPDKPTGRHFVLTPPPVKEVAQKYNLTVLQPNTLKNAEAQEQIKELKPDLIVVAAYGKILPKVVLDIPKYGCINVHGSLLPKYRGAAPIQRAVMDGEKVSGVTIMQMAEGLDTGDILTVKETPIGEDETAGELFDRIAVLGADALIETINNLDNIKPIKQNDEESCYASMLSKSDGIIDFSKTKNEVYAQIRGVTPWPGAFTEYKGKRIKILKAQKNEGGPLVIQCKDGGISLITVQPDGKKPMDADAFLRGIR